MCCGGKKAGPSGLETIEARRRPTVIASGVSVPLGLRIPAGHALVLSFPEPVTVELKVPGDASHVYALEGGMRQIVARQEFSDALFTSTASGTVQIEDLSVLRDDAS